MRSDFAAVKLTQFITRNRMTQSRRHNNGGTVKSGQIASQQGAGFVRNHYFPGVPGLKPLLVNQFNFRLKRGYKYDRAGYAHAHAHTHTHTHTTHTEKERETEYGLYSI